MSKPLRYILLVVGCLVQATVVAVCLDKPAFCRGEHQPFFAAPGWWLWMALLCSWPAWSVLLWKFGFQRKGAVLLPLLAGLAIMWRVLAEVAFLFIAIAFPNAVRM